MRTMIPTGARVGAILDLDKDQVRLIGYGVCAGLQEPPFGPFGISAEDFKDAIKGAGTPYQEVRIDLDGGGVIWGSQCWWSTEAEIKDMIAGKNVVKVPWPIV